MKKYRDSSLFPNSWWQPQIHTDLNKPQIHTDSNKPQIHTDSSEPQIHCNAKKYTATQIDTLQCTKNTAIRDTSSKCIQKDLILP